MGRFIEVVNGPAPSVAALRAQRGCEFWAAQLRNIAPASFLLLYVLLLSTAAASASIEGEVINVAEGDTITVLVKQQEYRIRLKGVDAPEQKQPFGNASQRSLSVLLTGKHVRVEYDKLDRYGGVIGVVWVRSPDSPCESEKCRKTLDAGLYQLTVGMAWWYRHYAKEQTPEERGQYEYAEAEARSRRAGLWAAADPTAPWDWRLEHRRAVTD